MSLWSQRMREWVDCFLGKHDDAYLAEKLARAVEAADIGRYGLGPATYDEVRAVAEALQAFRARNPRQS